MKKILWVLAGIAMACSVQAATITWKTGTGVKGANADGSFTTANAGSGTLSMYVFILSAADYNSLDVASVVDTYASQLSSATESVTGKSGSTGVTVQTTHDDWVADQNTTYYAAILTEYKSGDIDMFIGNKATAIVNGSGAGGTVNNLAKYIGGGTSGTAISGYTGAVPEPTSGLLFLLGIAGLALKRKRA